MEKTAVQILTEKLEKLIPPGNQLTIGAIYEQAKEIEKQQVKNAFDYGIDVGECRTIPINSEQYYQNTFGGSND